MTALAETVGNPPHQMSDVELSNAIMRVQYVLIDRKGGVPISEDRCRFLLKDGARAIMQLWRDCENRGHFDACADVLERRNRARKTRRLEHA